MRDALRLLDVVDEPLVLVVEHPVLRRVPLTLLRELGDLRVQLLLLHRRANARGARHLAFHELQLEVGGVHELALPLRALVELLELRARVARHALSSRNLREQMRLLLAQREELLPLVEHLVLKHR